MYDVIIKNGNIIDGTGRKRYCSNIGIKDDKIASIGTLPCDQAIRIIDATDSIVCPGFIDIHSHADVSVPYYPNMESCLMQGITTVVGGQCGYAPAPCDRFWTSQFIEMECLYAFATSPGVIPLLAPVDEMVPLIKQRFDVDFDWRTYHEYVSKIEHTGIGANMRMYAGHGAIRSQVLGWDHKRHATEAELHMMKDYLLEAMAAGACGVSFGLDYAPGAYASYDELRSLAETARDYGGMVAFHWRKTGVREAGALRQARINGILEAISVCKEVGVRTQISHIGSGFEVYPSDPDVVGAAVKKTIDIIESARKEGADVYYDVIPNITGGICIAPDLAMPVLRYMLSYPDRDTFAASLSCSKRNAIKKDILEGKLFDINPSLDPEWAQSLSIVKHRNEKYEGKTIYDISLQLNASPIDAYLSLIKEDPYALSFQSGRMNSTESIKHFLSYPLAGVGTDSFAVDLTPLFKYKEGMPAHYPNPNTYCGMINYITKFAPGSLEETIRRITGLASEMAKLNDCGTIKEGLQADIVIFREGALDVNSSYLDPRQYPKGIQYVLVNGKLAVEKGRLTYSMSGMVKKLI